jgi:hypothetical protein
VLFLGQKFNAEEEEKRRQELTEADGQSGEG